MFPLRRKAVIGGYNAPTIGQLANVSSTGINHRFDGENHTGFKG